MGRMIPVGFSYFRSCSPQIICKRNEVTSGVNEQKTFRTFSCFEQQDVELELLLMKRAESLLLFLDAEKNQRLTRLTKADPCEGAAGV